MKRIIIICCLVLVVFQINSTYSQNTTRLPSIDKILTISVYIVNDSLGDAYIEESDIQDAIIRLDELFKPINLSFSICKFNYIDNFQYDSIFYFDHGPEMYSTYYTPNTINMYFVSGLLISETGGVCVHAFSPEDSLDIIYVNKFNDDCMADSYELAKEMGRFLGLYDTDESQFGAELVDGSNCASAGDKVCDTEADAGGGTDAACRYISALKDVNDDFLAPLTDNIMSNYPDECKCRFTFGQYSRVVETLQTSKKHLW